MKYVRLYARVSTDEQRKKDSSIPAQLEKLNDYCKENNCIIMGTYIDNGISAATIKKRKDFCRLLEEVKKDEIIIFTRLDRFSRNILDANTVLNQLDSLHAGFKAILEEDIDVTTADGKFMFDLKVSLAERERKKTKERILDVFEYKLNRGELINGKLPKGYKRVDKKAEIIDEEAIFVKDCFDVIEVEMNTYSSMKILNSKWGINHDRKYYVRLWRKECYIGLYRGCELYPPIIDKEQFRRVQDILDNRYIKITPTGRKYIFSGLLVCSNCGRKLGATTTSGSDNKFKYKLYRCANIAYGEKTHCCYSEKKLESKILNLIMPAIKKYLYNLELQEKEIQQNRDIIKSSKQKVNRLQELYIDGKIDKTLFDKKYNGLLEIIAAEERKGDVELIQSSKDKYQDLLSKDILALYTTLSDDDKGKFWRSFIDKIVVYSYDDIRIFLL